MKAKPKTTVKLKSETLESSKRWESFLYACQLPFEELSDEWNTFFVKMGHTSSTAEELNEAIDAAREK